MNKKGSLIYQHKATKGRFSKKVLDSEMHEKNPLKSEIE